MNNITHDTKEFNCFNCNELINISSLPTVQTCKCSMNYTFIRAGSILKFINSSIKLKNKYNVNYSCVVLPNKNVKINSIRFNDNYKFTFNEYKKVEEFLPLIEEYESFYTSSLNYLEKENKKHKCYFCNNDLKIKSLGKNIEKDFTADCETCSLNYDSKIEANEINQRIFYNKDMRYIYLVVYDIINDNKYTKFIVGNNSSKENIITINGLIPIDEAVKMGYVLRDIPLTSSLSDKHKSILENVKSFKELNETSFISNLIFN